MHGYLNSVTMGLDRRFGYRGTEQSDKGHMIFQKSLKSAGKNESQVMN
jgi:hypothetical protein